MAVRNLIPGNVMAPLSAFRDDPTPANAVALARSDFTAQNGHTADTEFTDALSKAEQHLRGAEESLASLRTMLDNGYHTQARRLIRNLLKEVQS